MQKKVIAIEPDPSPYKCLEKNLSHYKSKVSLHKVALGKATGKLTFYCQPDSADSSLIQPNNPENTIDVDVLRLDELVSQELMEEIDILKVEAEGAEPEVLKGATKLLKIVPFITVRASEERQGESTFPACERILKEAGYKCWDGGDGKQLLAEKV